jgi:hypothetical protein
MGFAFRKFFEGIGIVPKATSTVDSAGDIDFSTSNNKFNAHNGTTSSPLVTESHSATLINKTIDADLNTISNIENADIKAGAAIDRTKLASGSNDHVLINNGSGVMSSEAALAVTRGGSGASTLTGYVKGNGTSPFTDSATIPRADIAAGTINHVLINDGSGQVSSEATLAKSRGGSGQDNSLVTFPASGVLVTETATQSLSNKTLTSPIINTPSVDISTLTEQGSAPSTPSAGFIKVYAKTDDFLYILDSSGIEKQILLTASVTPTGVSTDFTGTTAPSGWVLASGKTIGSATSGATERANSDTQALYTLLWNDFSNTELPIQDSLGSPTTRGVSAAADFAANKRMPVPDLRGRVTAGKDNMGGTTASRITNANSGITGTTLGAAGGAETLSSHQHTINHDHGSISTSSDGAHTHSFTVFDQDGSISRVRSSNGLGTANSFSTSSSGSHTHSVDLPNFTGTSGSAGTGSHGNVQPTYMLNKIIKL